MHAEGRPSAQMGRLRREGRDGGAEVELVARSCLSRNDSVGSVVLARSACANPSSFARYGPGTGPRLAHSSACASICVAITSLPTESLRLSVSAPRRESLLKPMPRSGPCHWNEPRNVSKRMRQSRPQRRGDAEALGSCLRVSASRRENLLQPVDPKSGSCRPGANGTGPFQPQVRGEVSDGSGRTSLP